QMVQHGDPDTVDEKTDVTRRSTTDEEKRKRRDNRGHARHHIQGPSRISEGARQQASFGAGKRGTSSVRALTNHLYFEWLLQRRPRHPRVRRRLEGLQSRLLLLVA